LSGLTHVNATHIFNFSKEAQMSEDIYKDMTDKIMLTGSKIIPELFKMVADKQEATLLMTMPGTPDALAEKLGKPVEDIEKMCRELYQKGLAFKSFKTGTLGYKMCRDMVQFHDATILWPEAPKAYHDLWQQFMEEEWPHFARMAENFSRDLLPASYRWKNPLTSASNKYLMPTV
jgi:hypothetical protein